MIGMILGGLLLGGVLIATFWDELVDFFHRALDTIKKEVKAVIDYTKVFLKKVRKKVIEIVRSYYKKDGQHFVMTVTREIDASEVPEDILAKAKARENLSDPELEVTRELEMKLAS